MSIELILKGKKDLQRIDLLIDTPMRIKLRLESKILLAILKPG